MSRAGGTSLLLEVRALSGQAAGSVGAVVCTRAVNTVIGVVLVARKLVFYVADEAHDCVCCL